MSKTQYNWNLIYINSISGLMKEAEMLQENGASDNECWQFNVVILTLVGITDKF